MQSACHKQSSVLTMNAEPTSRNLRGLRHQEAAFSVICGRTSSTLTSIPHTNQAELEMRTSSLVRFGLGETSSVA